MIKKPDSEITLGIVIGNRGFFPHHLCESGRQTITKVLSEEGIKYILLDPTETFAGSVESYADSEQCASLFRRHRDEIDGILVTLPNFGDEKAIANTLRKADLDVPVLIHAFPDELGAMTLENRRDSFCGKISLCNNLHQYGIPFSLTQSHVTDPNSDSFRSDLRDFVSVCKVVNGLKKTRIGMVGARVDSFNTVRFSEKILERSGISIETLDLSSLISEAGKVNKEDPLLQSKTQQLTEYLPSEGNFPQGLLRSARLAVVLERWLQENDLQACAIECWTSLQKNYGVVPCLVMSLLTNQMIPCGCETDVAGVISMHALSLAAGSPSALVDWNNNYADDPNMGVLFHCSNLPKNLLADKDDSPCVGVQGILAKTVGEENAWGAVRGRLKSSPVTFCKVSTDDLHGDIHAYLAEGDILDQKLATFGGYGVARIDNFQGLLKYISLNGFEHHVALNYSKSAKILHEAFTKYLDWGTYMHGSAGQI